MTEIRDTRASIWTGEKFDVRPTKIWNPQKSTIVKVTGAGLCGTDRHLMKLPDFKNRSFGHEIVGELVQIGERLHSVGGEPLAIGDRVVVTPGIPCFECSICTTYAGHEHMCNHRRAHGFGTYRTDAFFPVGGFSNYIELLPELWVVRVPDEMTMDEAMFAEPVAIAIKTVERGLGGGRQDKDAGPGVAMRAAVIGLGPIGSAVSFVLNSLGADVYGFDRNGWKAGMIAELFGIKAFETPGHSKESFEHIRSQIDTEFDVVFDCTGDPRGFELSLLLAKKAGRIVEVGAFAPGTKAAFDPALIVRNELEVMGAALSPVYTYAKVMRLLAKPHTVDLPRLTTHTIGLHDMDRIHDIVAEDRFLKIHIDTHD